MVENTYYGIEKLAGLKSEMLAPMLNPINLFPGVGIGAGIAAALTPTLTKKQMKEQGKKTWSNMLIPGAAQYRLWKRLGRSQVSAGEKK